MQLDRELIDVTGDFRSLRFVLFKFALNLVGELRRDRICNFRLRHQRLLAALLTGEIHPRRGLVCHQCSFAVLAVKENVRIGFDFSDGGLCCFHAKYRAGHVPAEQGAGSSGGEEIQRRGVAQCADQLPRFVPECPDLPDRKQVLFCH